MPLAGLPTGSGDMSRVPHYGWVTCVAHLSKVIFRSRQPTYHPRPRQLSTTGIMDGWPGGMAWKRWAPTSLATGSRSIAGETTGSAKSGCSPCVPPGTSCRAGRPPAILPPTCRAQSSGFLAAANPAARTRCLDCARHDVGRGEPGQLSFRAGEGSFSFGVGSIRRYRFAASFLGMTKARAGHDVGRP